MAIATVDDVETRWGQALTDDQIGQVATLLEDAEAEIRQRIDLDGALTAGRTTETLVKRVEAEMVIGVLRNPNGYIQTTESLTNGPFSSTRSGTLISSSSGQAATAGLLTLSRRQLHLLGAPRGARSVPVGDDALRHPLRRRYRHGWDLCGDDDEPYGYVWPAVTP